MTIAAHAPTPNPPAFAPPPLPPAGAELALADPAIAALLPAPEMTTSSEGEPDAAIVGIGPTIAEAAFVSTLLSRPLSVHDASALSDKDSTPVSETLSVAVLGQI
jgi:hypothetical protein